MSPGDRVFVIWHGAIYVGVMVEWDAPDIGQGQCRVRTGPPDGVWVAMEHLKSSVAVDEAVARALFAQWRTEQLRRLERDRKRLERLDPATAKIEDRTQPKPRRNRGAT